MIEQKPIFHKKCIPIPLLSLVPSEKCGCAGSAIQTNFQLNGASKIKNQKTKINIKIFYTYIVDHSSRVVAPMI